MFRLAITVVVLCASVLLVGDPANVKYIGTPVGEILPLRLSDGARITLNTDTRIRLHSDDAMLRVTLFNGEVLLDTRDNPRRHCLTSVGQLSVDHRGALFAARLFKNGTTLLSVQQGRIDLWENRKMAGALHENQIAILDRFHSERGIDVRDVSAEVIARQLSWQNGELVFERASLAEVVEEMNRYNLVHIEVVDPQTGEQRVSGAFMAMDPFAFVRAVTRLDPRIRWECARARESGLVLKLRRRPISATAVPESPQCAWTTVPG